VCVCVCGRVSWAIKLPGCETESHLRPVSKVKKYCSHSPTPLGVCVVLCVADTFIQRKKMITVVTVRRWQVNCHYIAGLFCKHGTGLSSPCGRETEHIRDYTQSCVKLATHERHSHVRKPHTNTIPVSWQSCICWRHTNTIPMYVCNTQMPFFCKLAMHKRHSCMI